jgi:hypothetical protein
MAVEKTFMRVAKIFKDGAFVAPAKTQVAHEFEVLERTATTLVVKDVQGEEYAHELGSDGLFYEINDAQTGYEEVA